MKYAFIALLTFSLSSFHQAEEKPRDLSSIADTSRNIFVITIDGFRWQEMFKGADSTIINNIKFCSDPEMISGMYGGETAKERRKKLMPFVWNLLASKGQLYGNRDLDNDVNVSNLYDISYAGYNEMFTGTTDLSIYSNDKKNNRNKNIFEYLGNKDAYKGKIALFTSWDVFPYILNEKRSGLEINSGYKNVPEETEGQKMLNTVQTDLIQEKEHTRRDMLTFIAAKEYLSLHHPKVFFLGLGETDEYAHKGNYDMYLQKANEADDIIRQLWHWAQTTEGYKNNTTFIITTDHGRGKSAEDWTSHGTFVKGSSQTWLLVAGKGVKPEGEMNTSGNIYQKQIAQTIANMLGEDFGRQARIDFAVN